MEAAEKPETKSVKTAFGADNRNRLIGEFFSGVSQADLTVQSAWQHVYRLLLWTDQTTGLAHCYESDKCQPGGAWYARSLAFHDWLSTQFSVSPANLHDHLDWLFLRVTADLAAENLRRAVSMKAAAERQRAPYQGRGFPNPGEDAELISIVEDSLGTSLAKNVSAEAWQLLVQRTGQYFKMENKRKNLVGEGFEDVLAHVLRRTSGAGVDVRVRQFIQDLPGFTVPKKTDKPNKVDVAIIRPKIRTIVTSKWSVRADREEQFASELSEYLGAETDGKPFEYVWVTNEFDPARLKRSCEKMHGNALMFKHVVHISTDALRATYGDKADGTMRGVLNLIDDCRLISLEDWIKSLNA